MVQRSFRVFALFALAFALCLSVRAQEEVTVKVELGVATKRPKKWTGEVSVAGAKLLSVVPWSLEQPDNDAVSGDGSFELLSRSGRKVSTTVENSPDGFLLRLSSPRATVRVTTNSGEFSFAPGRLALGEKVSGLGGDIVAQRLPTETRLSTPARDDDVPCIAAGPRETVWVVWVSCAQRREKILARKFDGRRWLPAEEVAPEGGLYHQPQAALDGQGTLWVAYSRLVGGAWELFAVRREANGWSKPQRLTSNPEPDIYPRLAGNARGQLALVWQSFREGQADVYLSVLQDGRWSAPLRVTNHPADDWEPDVAVAPDGTVVVAWDTYRNGSYDIYAATYSAGKLSPPLAIAATELFEAHASVACDNLGRAWIAWDIGGPEWGKDFSEKKGFEFAGSRTLGPIHTYRRLGLACLVAGERHDVPDELSQRLPPVPMVRFVRNTDRGGPHYEYPRLAVDRSGRLWLFYRTNPYGFYVHINSTWWTYGMYYGERGWSEPFLLPGSAGRNDIRASVRPAPEGGVWVAWAGDGRDFDWKQQLPSKSPKDSEVFAARLVAPGAGRTPKPGPAARAKPAAVAREPLRPRATLVRGGQRFYLFWGELHRHTDISWCSSNVDGSLLDTYRYAFDAARLDFLAITNHHTHQNAYEWWRTQKAADLFVVPGRFAAFYGYERSMGNGLGHRNIVQLERDLPIVYTPVELPDANDTLRLWKTLEGHRAITIPHQLSGPWHDWRYKNRKLEPVVELFQGHRGSYEYQDSPRPRGLSPGKNRGSLWDAYSRGVRVGVIASSDHMSTHVSYAGVYATDLSREAIFAALRARRTFAATDRIVLDVRIGEHIMGEECPAGTPPVLSVKVRATGPIERIDIVRDQQIIYSHKPKGTTAEFTFRDLKPPSGATYYYARVLQKDTNIAWSSPIWVGG